MSVRRKQEPMKQVQLRLPLRTMRLIEQAAKLANVTPTQVYNVILAMAIVRESAADRLEAPQQEGK